MKVAEMRGKSVKELDTHADKLRTQLAEKRRDLHGGQSTNVREIRKLRRELAQVLSVSGEKQREPSEKKPEDEEKN